MNSTVSNQTIKNDALQLLISAIARFCDIKTLRSLWGSNPHRFATCRGQPLNERGYLGEPSKRCGFCLLIQYSSLISSYASSIADSGLHYDWKAAKMMVNLAYISLSNISDVMEKTFLIWCDMDNYAASMVILVGCHGGLIGCFSSRIGYPDPYVVRTGECNMHHNW